MKKNIGIGALLFVVASVIFILSDNSIWIIDSIKYKFNFATGEKIRSIGDISESQYAHYFLWNGRYVAHWLCQLFVSFFSKEIFSGVNALMYIVLVVLVIRNVTLRKLSTRLVLSAICLVLFFCDTPYDPPRQIGYIWMAVLVLLFLRLYFNYAKNPRLSLPICGGLLLFSIIVGNGHEAFNVGVGGALIIFTLTHLRKLTAAQWCMTIGFGIGGLFLCMSPGTIGRTEEMVTSPIYSVINFFLSLRVPYILLAVLIYKLSRRRITLQDFYRDNTFFINTITVLIIFNFLIGVGGTRQLFGIELFSSILVLRLLKDQSFSKPVLCIFTLAIIGIYILKYIDIRKAYDSYRELSEKIAEKPTGPFFIDFPVFNPYINPTDVFRYGVYLDYAIISMVWETVDSQDIDLIPCYPTEAEKFFAEPAINRSYQYLPGEFMLMQSKKNPKKFTLHRSIHLFGIRIPLPPYAVEFDAESHLNTDEYNILYLPSILSVIENDSVTID